jgi:hypothetical protein
MNPSADAATPIEDVFGLAGDAATEHADTWQLGALDTLEAVFNRDRQQVFFSRQLEVQHEGQWFHWITNRALRELAAKGTIRREERELAHGNRITLMWHRAHRYYRRDAARVLNLVEEYADPNIGGALGLQGEAMILEGFARQQFVMHGRETRTFRSRTWAATAHDLDFIFERDGIAYGVEVKNTLGYMDHDELAIKIDMCQRLGIRPVFAARMLPKTWIHEINRAGGYALIFKYQLYPWAHRELARKVSTGLGLPVDAPRALAQGTMDRFVRWHDQQAT